MNAVFKKLLLASFVALPFVATNAQAETSRASCEADAKAQNIVGADRQMFMSACLPTGMAVDEPSQVAKVSENKPVMQATKATTTKVTKKNTKTLKANKTKVKKAVIKKPKAKKPTVKKNITKKVNKNVPAKVVAKPVQ